MNQLPDIAEGFSSFWIFYREGLQNLLSNVPLKQYDNQPNLKINLLRNELIIAVIVVQDEPCHLIYIILFLQIHGCKLSNYYTVSSRCIVMQQSNILGR